MFIKMFLITIFITIIISLFAPIIYKILVRTSKNRLFFSLTLIIFSNTLAIKIKKTEKKIYFIFKLPFTRRYFTIENYQIKIPFFNDFKFLYFKVDNIKFLSSLCLNFLSFNQPRNLILTLHIGSKNHFFVGAVYAITRNIKNQLDKSFVYTKIYNDYEIFNGIFKINGEINIFILLFFTLKLIFLYPIWYISRKKLYKLQKTKS